MSAREDDLRYRGWVEKARSVSTFHAAQAYFGFKPIHNRGAVKRIGGCTACGTTGSKDPKRADRFCIFISGPKVDGFACRKCGISGGDAIALVRESSGRSFHEAVELLTGEPCPTGRDERSAEERRAAEEKLEERKRELERRQQEAEAAAAKDLANRVIWAAGVWRQTSPLPGSPAEGYLRHRKIEHLDGLNLAAAGYASALRLKGESGRVLHEGPAMVWQVVDAGGHLRAVHRTWIAPEDFGQPDAKGRPRVVDEDGEPVATKKTLGDKQGNVIRLVRGLGPQGEPPRRLLLAEGIETLGAVREAMIEARDARLERAAFWCACDLYNLAFVRVPEIIEEVFLLGDGDSDPKTINEVFLAHMKVNNRPGRVFVPCFATPGMDFSDMWRAA